MKTLIAAAITACFLIGLLSLNGCIHLSHYPPSKYIGLVEFAFLGNGEKLVQYLLTCTIFELKIQYRS